jgi:predicted metal-dependent hydrolase
MDIKTSAQKNLFFSRKVKFNFSVEYQKNWFSNNSFLSHFMDTLSISIEKVEPYFKVDPKVRTRSVSI